MGKIDSHQLIIYELNSGLCIRWGALVLNIFMVSFVLDEHNIAFCTHSNGSPNDARHSRSHVPMGESQAAVPAGYLALSKINQSEPRAFYWQTQHFRQLEGIHFINACPQPCFLEIRAAYPHVVDMFSHGPERDVLEWVTRGGYLKEYLANILRAS